MWRKLRKIFFWTVGIFISLILILAFVIWLMQDKIKAYAIGYLNEHLKTELKVDRIDVTFISTFPNVSLHFKNTLILDPEGLQSYRDTLFKANDLYLRFGLWDVLSGNYNAQSLDIYNGHLRAFINAKGEENYDILKPQPPTPNEKKDFNLDLHQVKLYQTRLTYHNATGNQQYKFRTSQMAFEGRFSDTQYDLKAVGDLHIINLRNKNLVVFKNQPSDLELVLNINKDNRTYAFKKGDWKIGKMLLGLTGSVTEKDEGSFCDVRLFGKNISLVSVMQLLPDKVRGSIERYKSYGNLNLDAGIKGIMSKTKAPDVNASFDIGNGVLVEKSTNISLHNIDLKGNYTNRNKLGADELNITQMAGRFKDGTFNLSGRLSDFEKPHFVFSVMGHFSLATLHRFINPETVKDMEGNLDIDSKLDFVLLRTDDLLLTNTVVNEASGTVKFSDAKVLISEDGNPITGLNGQLNLRNNDALVDGLSGKVGTSDFSINGAIKDFTPYFLTGNRSLSVVGAFHSQHCNIADLVVKKKTVGEGHESKVEAQAVAPGRYAFPEKINFNVDLNINQLEWETFNATNIRGNFKLIDRRLSASGLNIDLAGGKCMGDITVDGTSAEGFMTTAHTQMENVQLPLVLKLFDNFGQDLITPQNTQGVLTAKTDWFFPVGPDLSIPQKKMIATASISIKKGELNEVEQLKKVAGFMRTDKKISLFMSQHADDFEQRVRHLKFDELKNEISIREGLLTIPRMEISSSAMKINFAGTHSFENEVDYHFNFRFNELKKRENETEFGEIRDDGTGMKVYIRMYGQLSDPKFEWDKDEKKADRQEQWQKEKENLKSILKEELGLFKKDTSVKVQQVNKDDVKFIMQWDEQETEKQSNQLQSEKDNKKLKKLKKKLGIDENGNKDVKFEVEQEP